MIKYLFFTWTLIFLPLASMHDKKFLALVEERIRKKQNLNISIFWNGNKSRKSLLCLAAEKPQNLVITLTLLQHGARPNYVPRMGIKETALSESLSFHTPHLETIQALLARGANPNEQKRGLSEDTPLHQLCSSILPRIGTPEFENREALIITLLKHGAHPNRKNIYGETPLFNLLEINEKHVQFEYNVRQAFIKILVRGGCDVFIRNNQGFTALDYGRCSPWLFSLGKEAKNLYRRLIFKLLFVEWYKQGNSHLAHLPRELLRIIFEEVLQIN